MAKLMLCVVLIAVVKGSEDEIPTPTKVACTGETVKGRDQIIAEAKCGEPKPHFMILRDHLPHEQISPDVVWVKRCVGLCGFHYNGDNCVPTSTTIRSLSVRILDVKTNKEACALYPVEEHDSCDCAARRLYNPLNNTSQCPIMEVGMAGLKKVR